MSKVQKSVKRKSKPKVKSLKDKLRPIVLELITEIMLTPTPQDVVLDVVLDELITHVNKDTKTAEVGLKAVSKYQSERRGEALKSAIAGVINATVKANSLRAERLSKTKIQPINRRSDSDIPESVKEQLNLIKHWTVAERTAIYVKLLKKYKDDKVKAQAKLLELEIEKYKYRQENIKRIVTEL